MLQSFNQADLWWLPCTFDNDLSRGLKLYLLGQSAEHKTSNLVTKIPGGKWICYKYLKPKTCFLSFLLTKLIPIEQSFTKLRTIEQFGCSKNIKCKKLKCKQNWLKNDSTRLLIYFLLSAKENVV